jgi:histidine triad (HIT) family protein
MPECIFCKIIRGELPSSKIYEDQDVIAFLDIMPVNKGHVLIIPKKHHETMLDVPDELLSGMMVASKKVASAVRQGLGCPGFNIQMNNYEAAGQVVPHAHLHIVPRYKGDGLRLWPGGKYKEGEREDIAAKISHFL